MHQSFLLQLDKLLCRYGTDSDEAVTPFNEESLTARIKIGERIHFIDLFYFNLFGGEYMVDFRPVNGEP